MAQIGLKLKNKPPPKTVKNSVEPTKIVKFKPKITLWELCAGDQKFNLVHRPHSEFKKITVFRG